MQGAQRSIPYEAEFTIRRSDLLAPLQAVAGIADGRIIQALGFLRMQGDGSSLRLEATDIHVHVVRRLEISVDVLALCVDAKRFLGAVSSFPANAEIQFSIRNNGRMEIQSGGARYQLPVMPEADFPQIETQVSDHMFKIKAGILSSMFSRARIASSRDDVRTFLMGLHIFARSGYLYVEAGDGHRLCRLRTELPEGAEKLDLIIPRVAVEHILECLEGDEASVEVNANGLRISVMGNSVMTKLIDSEFPDCDRLIPQRFDGKVEVGRLALIAATVRLTNFQKHERERYIRVCQQDANIRLIRDVSGDVGEEIIESNCEGAIEAFGINPQYLVDALTVMSGEKVSLRLAGFLTPLMIQDSANSEDIHMISKMRV